MVKNISKKDIAFLLTLVLLNLIIRIPSIPHEKGADSFYIHILANSVSHFSQANWWTNMHSVLGMYPNSYASATPFLISGFSQITLIDMENIILITSIILGIFCIFSAYIMGEELYPNTYYKYIYSFIYSLSQGILIFTTWEMSSRGVYLIIFPLFFYLLISLLNRNSTKKILLTTLLLVFLFATHKFAYFALFIGIFAIAFQLVYNKLNLLQKLNPSIYMAILSLSFILPFFKRSLISSGSKYEWIQQMALIEIRFVGPLFFLIVPGIMYLILKNEKTKYEIFTLLLAILLAPILYSQTYGHFIYIPFSLILLSIGIKNILTINNPHIKTYIIIILIVFVAFSSFYNHWRTNDNQEDWYLGEDVYVSAQWANQHFSENAIVIGNNDITMKRFEAISNTKPKVLNEDIMATIYGFSNTTDYPMIEHSPFSLKYYFDSPVVLESGHSINGKINWIFAQNDIDYSTSKEIISLYSISNIIMDTEDNKPAFNSIYNQKNLIYSDDKIKIWGI